jgi:hypothetical protein
MTKLSTITRQINSETALRSKLSYVGSFIALRIEDPEGRATVADATVVQHLATRLLKDEGLIAPTHNGHPWGHHFGGVVMNWEAAR